MPLNRPTFILTLLGLAAFAALAALACTSSSTETTPTPAPQPTIVDDADTRAAAESALLVLSDFPEAWEEQPPDPDDDDDDLTLTDAPLGCQEFVQQDELAGTLFELEISEFHGPDSETVESRVTVFDTELTAERAFAEVRRFQQDCEESIRAALLDYYEALSREESSDVTLVDYSSQLIEFPQYGGDTLATRFTFELEVDGEALTSYADIIDIRQGSLVGEFVLTTTIDPPDLDLARQLAQIIEPRLASAWDSITAPAGDE